MVERKGKLNAKQVDNVQCHTLTKEIIQTVKKTASLHTDEWMGYNGASKLYKHSIIKHGVGQYVVGNAYTNTIEGFGLY